MEGVSVLFFLTNPRAKTCESALELSLVRFQQLDESPLLNISKTSLIICYAYAYRLCIFGRSPSVYWSSRVKWLDDLAQYRTALSELITALHVRSKRHFQVELDARKQCILIVYPICIPISNILASDIW